jgi:hypothetical protein
MSFTRIRDDRIRMQKQNEQSVYAGNFHLATPGPGVNLPFMEDPHIRVQQWGANLMTDSTNLESELRGLGRNLSHDPKPYLESTISNSTAVSYPSAPEFVDQTRASHPAWMCRVHASNRWETPFINPTAITIHDIDRNFNHNVSSRILEKDYYTPQIPDLSQYNF